MAACIARFLPMPAHAATLLFTIATFSSRRQRPCTARRHPRRELTMKCGAIKPCRCRHQTPTRAIAAPSPLLQPFHQRRSCRIQIDIATHFQKVGVFIHQNGLQAARQVGTGNKTILRKASERKPRGQRYLPCPATRLKLKTKDKSSRLHLTVAKRGARSLFCSDT